MIGDNLKLIIYHEYRESKAIISEILREYFEIKNKYWAYE